ncbi:Hydroxymethylpyrimidine kinase [Lactiplantibacillus plantarum subsp. plantarum]|uniref:Hydroxymethylpyrimidine kinase n=1 Tax=Lactiplantibacillus plantarum subsp. plantarum TaxID=337330 RepID=A0A2S3U307_LACPN|nr:Hydroxymethylpyrimidine kinase [Lactiplantibacillus plantarum subsp. plantarum]
MSCSIGNCGWTPNLPEAERLTGHHITSNQDMVAAGHALQDLGAATVIIKGGHGDNPDLANDFVLLADGTAFWMSAPRIETVRTHGTGDTLSACITAELAKGQSMAAAFRQRKLTWRERFKTVSKLGMVTVP